MIRRLVVTYLAITMFGLALLAIPLGLTFAHREKDRLLFVVERDADTMSALVEDSLEASTPVPVDKIVQYARQNSAHVTVVDRRGIALADSDQITSHPNDSKDPEIQIALTGKLATGTRYSAPLHTTVVYAAVPVSGADGIHGAVRIIYGTKTIDDRVRRMWEQIALLCAGVLVVVAFVGFVLARTITHPIRRLQVATDRFATGDLAARVVEVDTDAAPPELRNLATTFNRMADRLARVLEAQQRFVADASHQLRTPLTALRLRLENLASDENARDRTALDAAGAEVARMSQIIDGLLLLARDDASGSECVPVDVAAVARDRVEVWQDAAAEKNVTLVGELPSAARASALPGAVEQLVDNLVDNALVVSPPGSCIVVRVEVTASGVALHVIDEGPGLDASGRERAFERFWRGPHAEPGGSGLGLAIVRGLAVASHGTAELEPAPNGGLDAVVILPVASDDTVA
jgi:signal transduction histidine kinase